MSYLDENSTLEELEEAVKDEHQAFEAARLEVRKADERSAAHYYRLGQALVLAKEKLGRGGGKPGTFRGWHVGLGVNKDTASRAMRLYEAASEDGGEVALAGLGWWKALIHYEIVQERSDAKATAPNNHWDNHQRWGDDDEVDDPGSATTALPSPASPVQPTFNDIPYIGGFRTFLVRHLIALGAEETLAERIAKDKLLSIQECLTKTLKEHLEEPISKGEPSV